MHKCFTNHDIRVFRDPYVSSTGECLTAVIATKNKCVQYLLCSKAIQTSSDDILLFYDWGN